MKKSAPGFPLCGIPGALRVFYDAGDSPPSAGSSGTEDGSGDEDASSRGGSTGAASSEEDPSSDGPPDGSSAGEMCIRDRHPRHDDRDDLHRGMPGDAQGGRPRMGGSQHGGQARTLQPGHPLC